MATVDFLTFDAGQSPPLHKRSPADTLPPAALPVATTTDAGAMSAADKAKLDGIEAGAKADQTAAEVPFTPSGNIAATNVQAAIEEVAAEAGSGSGNVSSTGTPADGQVARWSGGGADTIKGSPVSISDAGAVTGVASIAVSGLVDGRDVSADGAAQDAHIAAAAPHSGHATLVGGTVPLAQIPVLDSTKLGADSVGATQIAAGAVGTAELANGSVTPAKQASVPTNVIIGRVSSGSGEQEALSPPTARNILNVEDNAQENRGTNLGSGGASVFKQVNGSGTPEYRRINGGLSSTSIQVTEESDYVQIGIASKGINQSHIASDSVGYPELKNLSGPVVMGRVSPLAGDPESITPGTLLGMLGVEAGAQAPPYSNADLATMQPATFKGRVKGSGSGVPVDMTAVEARRGLNVEPASGALASIASFRTPRRDRTRIQRAGRKGKWTAGDATMTGLLDSHGTRGHLYPFMTFATVDSNGHPHSDHDRINNAGGPDLVTNVEAVAGTTGLGIFRIAGTWSGYSAGRHVESMGFTGANNGYFEVSGVSGGDLTVLDPNDVITAEGAETDQEVRGMSERSQLYGYLQGIGIPPDALRADEQVEFYGAGFVENPNAGWGDAFVEFVLEPNPQRGVYDGANRIEMRTGELGATWTGQKGIEWWTRFLLGASPTEWHVFWRIRIDGICDVEGAYRKTGGFSFQTTHVVLSPRWRVGRVPNIDLYTEVDQAQGLRCQLERFSMGGAR